ncbi:MAG: nucleoside hydrolase [Pyrinomonadaceae bacterium]|nr:nucleoside hydrolase [Pyrinomonadaceae bacterium]
MMLKQKRLLVANLIAPLLITLVFGTTSSAQTPKTGRNGRRPPTPAARRAVVLTTDCGADMDDQWTLAQLALAPELELRGVVTTHAPSLAAPAADTAARVSKEVFDHLPLKTRPPIIAGSSVPLTDKTRALDNRGVQFLLEQSRIHSPARRLAVLVTGAATDVASALLIEPHFADRVEIIAMGFEGWPVGDDPWNVKNDVRAWQVLLESRAPITVGDAAVTKRDLLIGRRQAHELFAEHGLPGRYLADLHTAWLDKEAELCQKVTGSPDTWPVWDQVTVAYLLGLTRGKIYPRPALRDDMRFTHPARTEATKRKAATITWITAIQSDALWKHFKQVMSNKK